jgi:hypothetical protein
MWASVPQKVIEKRPVYVSNPICIRCSSTNVFSIMKMIDSPLMSTRCKYTFNKQIIGYKDVLIKK